MNWIERAQHRVGKDFDDFLLHSARVLRIARTEPDDLDLMRIGALADYYLEQGYPDQPSRFFSFPRKPPKARVVEERPFSDGNVRTYAFPSGYSVKNPDFREEYRNSKENR